MTKEITVGSTVRVVDSGKGFTTYAGWAVANGLARWSAPSPMAGGDVGVVKVIAKHTLNSRYGLLAGVERSDGTQFIIGLSGLVNTDPESAGVDAEGNMIEFGLDDIKDFMRVVIGGAVYVVFTNARVDGLPKYITNGKDKARKLDFSEVMEVYSQPVAGLVLSPFVRGKLRFRRIDTAKLRALQADVAKAEAALAAAKAALGVGK